MVAGWPLETHSPFGKTDYKPGVHANLLTVQIILVTVEFIRSHSLIREYWSSHAGQRLPKVCSFVYPKLDLAHPSSGLLGFGRWYMPWPHGATSESFAHVHKRPPCWILLSEASGDWKRVEVASPWYWQSVWEIWPTDWLLFVMLNRRVRIHGIFPNDCSGQ